MRLIDADKFIRWIDLGHLRHPSELCFSEVDVVNMINHQPTAYDVKAVVEELENEFEWSADTFHGTEQMDYLGELRAYDNAIRIVKRGGIK